MASIREINVGGTLHDVKSTHYATCTTAAATAAKVATIQNGSFTLETGVKVSVKFTYANSAASATLNVNSTGAKTIQFAGAALTSAQYWVANQVVDFVYDGTYWAISGAVKDNNTTYSLPTASSSTLGGVKIGSNISISDGVISVPAASGSAAGVTIVYPAASCTTFTSDSGTCTPLAVQKAVGMFEPKAHTHSDYVNQNAFSNVTIGSTTIAADSATDTLTLVAGSNITLTPDATNDKITIAASTNAGTITGVTAGNGLTGGGTSGAVTLNVGAGTGISVAADAVSLATSGVTAGTYGPSANVTGSNNATINVPQITVDAYGRVTSVTNRVYTSVNTDTNTDTQVTQAAAITTNGSYPLLLGYSTATTAVTNTVNKTTTLNYNPSTKALTTGNIVLSSGYGTTLPSSGVEGQIFFLVVD